MLLLALGFDGLGPHVVKGSAFCRGVGQKKIFCKARVCFSLQNPKVSELDF